MTYEIGEKAEQIALEFERQRVGPALAHKVRLVSSDSTLGYDLESVTVAKTETQPRFIEVKALNKSGYFFASSGEKRRLTLLGELAWIYVVDITSCNVVRMINNPFKQSLLRSEVSAYKIHY